MMPDGRGFGLLLLSTFMTAVVCAVEHSAEVCRELGFDKNSLLCSSCEGLPEKNLHDLVGGCKACCIQDNVNAEAAVKYPRARLEVCG